MFDNKYRCTILFIKLDGRINPIDAVIEQESIDETVTDKIGGKYVV